MVEENIVTVAEEEDLVEEGLDEAAAVNSSLLVVLTGVDDGVPAVVNSFPDIPVSASFVDIGADDVVGNVASGPVTENVLPSDPAALFVP